MDEVLTAGDVLVVLGHVRVAVKETGRRAEAPFAHVWRFRSGQLVWWRCYEDTQVLQQARA